MRAGTIKRMWMFSGFLLCLFLAFTPGNANALPYAEGSFVIDWSTVEFNPAEGLSISPFTNPDGISDMEGSFSKAKVVSDPDWADKTDPEEKIKATGSTTAHMANDFATSTTNSTIGTMMSGTVSAEGQPGVKYRAESEAKQWMYFTVKGSGILELTVDYYLEQSVDFNAVDEWAKAKSEVKLELGKSVVEVDSNDIKKIKNEKINKDGDNYAEFKIEWKDLSGPVDPYEKMGTLTVEYEYTEGASPEDSLGFMKVTAKNKVEAYKTPPSPVPEPATMLLFGSGLICLAGLRRKFKK